MTGSFDNRVNQVYQSVLQSQVILPEIKGSSITPTRGDTPNDRIQAHIDKEAEKAMDAGRMKRMGQFALAGFGGRASQRARKLRALKQKEEKIMDKIVIPAYAQQVHDLKKAADAIQKGAGDIDSGPSVRTGLGFG